MSKRKKALIWIVAILLLAALVVSPLGAFGRSVAVMSVISSRAVRESVQESQGFEISIPSDDGWYPFVLAHNADGAFERLSGADGARLTIMYNFPGFDCLRGCSRLFDEASPYYNSFYGAYLTSLPNGSPYGFSPEGPGLNEAVAAVARLDFFYLVLDDFGITREESVFEYELVKEETDVPFAGSGGWTRIDAKMLVNGAAHKAQKGVQSYWQYGVPRFPVTAPFSPVKMYCTVIAKYFEEWNTTVFFYVISSDAKVRDDCVENILSQSKIGAKGSYS